MSDNEQTYVSINCTQLTSTVCIKTKGAMSEGETSRDSKYSLMPITSNAIYCGSDDRGVDGVLLVAVG